VGLQLAPLPEDQKARVFDPAVGPDGVADGAE
jgi:hypothetical protein